MKNLITLLFLLIFIQGNANASLINTFQSPQNFGMHALTTEVDQQAGLVKITLGEALVAYPENVSWKDHNQILMSLQNHFSIEGRAASLVITMSMDSCRTKKTSLDGIEMSLISCISNEEKPSEVQMASADVMSGEIIELSENIVSPKYFEITVSKITNESTFGLRSSVNVQSRLSLDINNIPQLWLNKEGLYIDRL